MRFALFFALPALLILAVDFATKSAAEALGIEVSFNSGVSFGFLAGTASSFAVASGVTVAVALFAMSCAKLKDGHPMSVIGCGMMCGGAVGNVFDRLRFDSVVDWIKIPFSDIFFSNGLVANVADFALCVGAVFAVVGILADGEKNIVP
ncbi:MAG: signal peptidase II [Synergistes sp.]|nr:signal peptidase II [Synergistes sp.]